jgi:hypothetical protein
MFFLSFIPLPHLILSCVTEKQDLDMDSDGFSINDGDCDDLNADIYPDAEEQCDEIDNDCDGLIDENIPLPENTVYFIDADEDGYGGEVLISCQNINMSYSTEHGDCNDQNPNIHPTAPDVCADNLDSDCDGFDDSPLCHQHPLELTTSISSVATAPMGTAKYVGDINNDGIADVALGGSINEDTQYTGIFFGPFDRHYTTDEANILINMNENNTTPLGSTVVSSGKGDINNDGHDDLMLSLIDHNNYGEIYLFTNIGDAENYDISDAIILMGDQEDSLLSTNPVFLGDISGDGVDDFAFNARRHGNDSGAVYLFFHQPETGSVQQADIIFYGEEGDQTGSNISSLNDGNGDGFRELLISAFRAENPTSDLYNAGAIYVFDGGEGGFTEMSDARLRIFGDLERAQMGSVVKGTGDLDGDGLPDILSSSHYYPNNLGDNGNGVAWGISGTLTGDISRESTLFQIEGDDNDNFGRNVQSCGDMNNDGYDDIAVSAKYTDYLIEDGGSIHIFYGPLSGTYTKNEAHEIISSTNTLSIGILTDCIPSVDTSPNQFLFSDAYYDGSEVQNRTYFMPWLR